MELTSAIKLPISDVNVKTVNCNFQVYDVEKIEGNTLCYVAGIRLLGVFLLGKRIGKRFKIEPYIQYGDVLIPYMGDDFSTLCSKTYRKGEMRKTLIGLRDGVELTKKMLKVSSKPTTVKNDVVSLNVLLNPKIDAKTKKGLGYEV